MALWQNSFQDRPARHESDRCLLPSLRCSCFEFWPCLSAPRTCGLNQCCIRDPVPFWPLDPGSGKDFFRIPNPPHCYLGKVSDLGRLIAKFSDPTWSGSVSTTLKNYVDPHCWISRLAVLLSVNTLILNLTLLPVLRIRDAVFRICDPVPFLTPGLWSGIVDKKFSILRNMWLQKKVWKQIFFHPPSLLLLFFYQGPGMGKNQDPG